MSNINDLILSEAHSNEKIPTKGDVGAGYGKYVGGAMGGPIGYAAGYYVGRHHLVKHPTHAMDKNSALDRTGAMLDNHTKLKHAIIRLGGAALGAALGGKAGHHYDKFRSGMIHKHHKGTNAGVAIGAALGSLAADQMFGSGKANRHLAKKLGYGKFGRFGASLTPAAGLFKPKRQQEEEDKD